MEKVVFGKTKDSGLHGKTSRKKVETISASTFEVPSMPKVLCIISLVVSSIILLVFLMNLFAGIPFGSADGMMLMNIGMVVGCGIIATFSVLTFLEQR